MFKIINYSTFNMVIEKKRTASKFTTTAITTIQYTTNEKNPDRKQMRLKSIGRAQIDWSILINPMECIHSFVRRSETMTSSSIFQFQFQFNFFPLALTHARAILFCILFSFCFYFNFFLHQLCISFTLWCAHGVECFYFHFIYLMALHSGRLGGLFFSLCLACVAKK